MNITDRQLKRLQVLYRQYEAHSLDAPGKSRECRLTWATEQLHRDTSNPVTSFSDLTLDEGIRLIDSIQRALRVKMPSKSPRRNRPRDRKAAEKAGTEGRHDQIHQETTLAGPADFERVQRQMDRLGWDLGGLQRFLRGASNPIKGSQQVRTLWESNRVYWALKNIPARKERPVAS